MRLGFVELTSLFLGFLEGFCLPEWENSLEELQKSRSERGKGDRRKARHSGHIRYKKISSAFRN